MSTQRGLMRYAPDSTTDVSVSGLGVDDELFRSRSARVNAPFNQDTEECRLLHVSSDQSWPGRKGTEELLHALAIIKGRSVSLRLHIPPALHRDAATLVRDLDIEDMVDIEVGGRRGSNDGWFERELNDAHMVVAPSRCEGFGIMMASALVAGVPLQTTAVTGQLDFLSYYPGWMALPTDLPSHLAGEPSGEAPMLSPLTIASHLELATTQAVRMRLLLQLRRSCNWEKLTWRRAAADFARLLMQWQERE
jgi:glycosyltransferase involved in cell wall biosynthesis